MALGEQNHPHPKLHLPFDGAANFRAALDNLQCFLPGDDEPVVYTSNHFRMYLFKVRLCQRGRPHKWSDCPYAHPGEKARRRDPLRFRYSSAVCPDHRRGGCRKGEACELSHGVFECWLHPERYRTHACKDGVACSRRVCFFAHTTEQLRVNSPRSVLGFLPESPTYGSQTVSPAELQFARPSRGDRMGGGVWVPPAREGVDVGWAEEGLPDVGWITELLK